MYDDGMVTASGRTPGDAVIGLELLAGVKVVSFEQYISGPYCTSVLADAGAEVVKVERPERGDPRRHYDPKLGNARSYVSSGFASYNRSKKSICLDLSKPEDNEALGRLLTEADVLVSNLRPGSLAKFGWNREHLRAEFPRLILCEISGFGMSGGPYAGWPAFDPVIQAMSGLSSLIGDDPNGPPQFAPMGSLDVLSGTWAAMGILMALVDRATTGRAAHVDAAMYDVGAAFVERALALYEFTNEVPTRGTDAFSPVGFFRAGDGKWVSIVIPTDEMWIRCCRVVEDGTLAAHPQLDTVLKRAANMKDLIIPRLELWAAEMHAHEAAGRLIRGGQPAGVVQTVKEVRHCAHLRHRGLFADLDDQRTVHMSGARRRLPRLPLLFDGRGARPGPVPELGEHTHQIVR
jgi:crotonobetainyl-CoA:carnitine CoA-transferase CaiB-like acyl-CoA transferase